MGNRTRDTWPDETRDELLARIRREHGDDVARLVAADLDADHQPRRQVKRVVGNKPVARPLRPSQPAGGRRSRVHGDQATTLEAHRRADADPAPIVVRRGSGRRRRMAD